MALPAGFSSRQAFSWGNKLVFSEIKILMPSGFAFRPRDHNLLLSEVRWADPRRQSHRHACHYVRSHNHSSFIEDLGLIVTAQQFFLAGGLVTLGATVLIGLLVTDQIVETVTRNAGSTTALYVDSIIAPILPDLTRATKLDDSIERTLDETLGQGALGRRLVSFRLWTKDGTIIYSNDKRLMNMVVPPGENRTKAFAGELVANFEAAGDPESDAERALGEPS